MKKSPDSFMRARLLALYLLSLASVSGSILAWQGESTSIPLSLLWPPLGLGAAAIAGAALRERFLGLLERNARARVRALTGICYGAVVLIVSLGLLSGSRDAARGGTSILRVLQLLFLLLTGFSRGDLGALVNALALTSTSLLAGGPGAAVSATLLGSILVFFLTADHATRTLTEFPVEQLPPSGPILGVGAAAAFVIAVLLAGFFWLVPPAPYAPLQKAGAIRPLPAGELVGLLSNLMLVAIVSTVGVYLLLRFGGAGGSIPTEDPVAEFVSPQRKTVRPEAAPYREPRGSVKDWRARIVALYVKTAEQLAKWGRRRKSFQTPREFARSLAPAAASAELAELFGRARYGPDELTRAEFEQASRISREILDHHRRRS
ncbi:MAG TPA: DUF4129 domain-containing protein [Planctomycetota bacterium]|nr:DUF4129 domain-containing protein [Planctomycetota bacterium]